MAAMAPNTENKAFESCDIVCESSSSMITMSEENLFNKRPKGVTSKKATEAPNVFSTSCSCSCIDVPSLCCASAMALRVRATTPMVVNNA